MIDPKSLIANTALALLLAGAPAGFAQTAAPAPEAPAATEAPADAGTPEAPAAGEAPAAPQPYTAPSGRTSAPDAAAPAPDAPAAGAADAEPAEPPATDAAAAPAPAGDAMAAAQNLSPQVQDVQIVGPWTDGERSGVWRTIMMQAADEPERRRFFLQRIETVDGAQAVGETTEITEIAEIEGAIVGYRADEPSSENPGNLTLFFDIVPSDGEISETYELHYFQGSPYMFGPATN